MSLALGSVSLIWHIANLILYFTNNANKASLPIVDGMYVFLMNTLTLFFSLYWAEMVLNVLLIISNITLLLKVDFVPLNPEEIERVEIEELKHRMQIKDHQRA